MADAVLSVRRTGTDRHDWRGNISNSHAETPMDRPTRLLTTMPRTLLVLLFPLLAGLLQPGASPARDFDPRWGFAGSFSRTVISTKPMSFVMAHGVLSLDYESFWFHPAPKSLRFKIEPAVGKVVDVPGDAPADGALLSLNAFAQFMPEFAAVGRFHPYVEGGIGGIWTSFRLRHQGSNLNFNPQLGVGVEYSNPDGPDLFAAVRLHHVSNANLARENRGINSVMVLLGCLFK